MAGYSARQSTYVDGDVIDAADSNDEFNQILAAFNNSSGHKHDGTAGEGGVIGIIGDPGETTPLNKVVIDNPNNQIEFSIDVSSSSVEQLIIKDGVIEPTTDNDIDLGSSSKQFKDLFIDGTANIDSLVADTADINGGTIDGTVIGGTTAAAGNFTTVNSSGAMVATGGFQGVLTGSVLGNTTITTGTSTFNNVTANGTVQYGSLSDGTITITAFVDEDNMASNSATLVPTQQSVKAYVDSQLTAQDLDFQGDSGGALSIDLDSETLDIAGGTGIDTSGSGNTLTVAIDSTVATLAGSQTLTNKTLTAPVISTISNTGTITLPTSTDTLVGRATTDTLTNKTLTSPTVTTATLNGAVSGTSIKDEDDMTSNSASHLATQQSIKAYVDAQITAEDLDVTTDSGTIAIDLDSETLTIAGGTGLGSSATGNTVTLAIDSTVTTLTGTQTLTNKTLTSPTINGGSLSSAVTATTQAAGTNNTTIATTAFAQTAASNEAVALAIALG
jgi:hypothetical protein